MPTQPLSKSPQSQSSKHGFTLIELLVVISIIALLAAILFPVFSRVREKARQTACANNMKQLALGFLQYQQDNDEYAPCPSVVKDASTRLTTGQGWAGALFPYIKSSQVYTCPSDATQMPSNNYREVSYAINFNVAGSTAGYYPYPGGATYRLTSQHTDPSKTVMLCEVRRCPVANTPSFDPTDTFNVAPIAYTYSPSTNGVFLSNCRDTTASNCGAAPINSVGAPYYATGYMGGSAGERFAISNGCGSAGTVPSRCFPTPDGVHTDGSNYVFLDGHVKWLRGDQVSSGANALQPTDAQTAGDTSNMAYYTRAAGTQNTNAPYLATFSAR